MGYSVTRLSPRRSNRSVDMCMSSDGGAAGSKAKIAEAGSQAASMLSPVAAATAGSKENDDRGPEPAVGGECNHLARIANNEATAAVEKQAATMEPRAPLLERLAAMAEAEVRSIEEELGSGLSASSRRFSSRDSTEPVGSRIPGERATPKSATPPVFNSVSFSSMTTDSRPPTRMEKLVEVAGTISAKDESFEPVHEQLERSAEGRHPRDTTEGSRLTLVTPSNVSSNSLLDGKLQIDPDDEKDYVSSVAMTPETRSVNHSNVDTAHEEKKEETPKVLKEMGGEKEKEVARQKRAMIDARFNRACPSPVHQHYRFPLGHPSHQPMPPNPYMHYHHPPQPHFHHPYSYYPYPPPTSSKYSPPTHMGGDLPVVHVAVSRATKKTLEEEKDAVMPSSDNLATDTKLGSDQCTDDSRKDIKDDKFPKLPPKKRKFQVPRADPAVVTSSPSGREEGESVCSGGRRGIGAQRRGDSKAHKKHMGRAVEGPMGNEKPKNLNRQHYHYAYPPSAYNPGYYHNYPHHSYWWSYQHPHSPPPKRQSSRKATPSTSKAMPSEDQPVALPSVARATVTSPYGPYYSHYPYHAPRTHRPHYRQRVSLKVKSDPSASLPIASEPVAASSSEGLVSRQEYAKDTSNWRCEEGTKDLRMKSPPDDKPAASTCSSSSDVNNRSGTRCIHIYGARLLQVLESFDGNGSAASTFVLPQFHHLINYPDHLPRKSAEEKEMKREKRGEQKTSAEARRCVMCGVRCLVGNATLASSSLLCRNGNDTSTIKQSDRLNSGSDDNSASDDSTSSSSISNRKTTAIADGTTVQMRKDSSSGAAAMPHMQQQFTIPRQNKGLCTSCDVKVWLYVQHPQEEHISSPSCHSSDSASPMSPTSTGVAIKWCKGCKNFRHWPQAFGIEKSRATKCSRCRERQRHKYAISKQNVE